MQTMVIEFAYMCGLEHANSTEFSTPPRRTRVIYKCAELKGVDETRGTMRLAHMSACSQKEAARGRLTDPPISERHRHRLRIQREYEKVLTEHRPAADRPDAPGRRLR